MKNNEIIEHLKNRIKELEESNLTNEVSLQEKPLHQLSVGDVFKFKRTSSKWWEYNNLFRVVKYKRYKYVVIEELDTKYSELFRDYVISDKKIKLDWNTLIILDSVIEID